MQRCLGVAVMAILFGPAAALATDVPAKYLVDLVDLKKNAPAGTVLTWQLYSDSTCTAASGSPLVVNVEDVELIELIRPVKVKKGPRPRKLARLNQLLAGVPEEATYFLEVAAATGITPVGGACQPQATGAAGQTGVDGLDCWDLNANGTCDIATEDLDTSGECDTLDCQGPQGEPGICTCPSTTTTTSTTILPTTSTTIATPRFMDNGDGTITDNATGLMWEIKDNQGGLRDVDNQYPWAGVCSVSADRCQADQVAVNMCPIGYVGCSLCPPGKGTCQVVDGQGGSDTIFRWVARLNAAAFAGHADWRIPHINELVGILSEPYPCDFASPCVDPPFHNGVDSFTAGGMYWSETTHPSNPGSAWYARFSDAFNGWTGKTDSYFVRAVRNAQ